MNTPEIWKPIKGFEGLYEVSNKGMVKSLARQVMNRGKLQSRPERILKQRKDKRGYCSVVLCKEGRIYPKAVHRLVADAFILNPENKPVVDHVDTNASNNKVDNLRWCTQKENCNNPISRENNSLSKMGHPGYTPPEISRENIKKAQAAVKGKPLSEGHKKALSEAHLNSEVARKAARENIKKAHEYNRGTCRTDETRRKLSESNAGLHKGMTWKIVNGKRVWMEREVSNG